MLALKQVPAVKGLWEKASSPTSSRIKVGRGHRQLLSYLAAPSWQASRDRIIMLLMSPPRLALTRRSQSCHMCRTLKDIPHAIQMSYCSAGRLSKAQMGSTGEKKDSYKSLVPANWFITSNGPGSADWFWWRLVFQRSPYY